MVIRWFQDPGQVPRLEQSRNRWFIIVPPKLQNQSPTHRLDTTSSLTFHLFFYQLFLTVHSKGFVADQSTLPTNVNSEDLAMKQKHPDMEALASGISIRHPIPFSFLVHTRPGGIFMRPDKVADRAGRKAGCWTHYVSLGLPRLGIG